VKPQTLPPPRAVALSIMEVAAESLAPPPAKPVPPLVPAFVPRVEAPDLTALELEASGTKRRSGRGKGLLLLAALGGLGAGAWLARGEPVVAAAWTAVEGAAGRVVPALTRALERVAGEAAPPLAAKSAEAPPSEVRTNTAALEPARPTSAPGAAESLPVLRLQELPALAAAGEARDTSRAPSAAREPSQAHSREARESAAAAREPAAAGSRPGRAELVAAMNQVASAAASCGERTGPVRVQITFGESGVARSVRVSGEGLTPQLRSCISSAASRARVSAFSGEPITVAKSL
jgi:hypothetical protein